MKRFLLASILALVLLAGSQQTASAWSKFNVMIGLNISYEGGGNCLLWGLARGAPFPGDYGGWGGGDGYYGYQGYPASHDTQPQQWQAPAPSPAPQQNPPTTPGTQQTTQAVGYYYYGYTGHQAPSYWYGR